MYTKLQVMYTHLYIVNSLKNNYNNNKFQFDTKLIKINYIYSLIIHTQIHTHNYIIHLFLHTDYYYIYCCCCFVVVIFAVAVVIVMECHKQQIQVVV